MRFYELLEAKSPQAIEAIRKKYYEGTGEKSSFRARFEKDSYIRVNHNLLIDFSDDNMDEFDAFLKIVMTSDPTKKSIYVDWILRMYDKGMFNYFEDIFKLSSDFTMYEKLKSKIPVEQRDINYFKSVAQFVSFINDHKGTDVRSNNEQEKEYENNLIKSGQAEIFYNSSDIKIIIPHTKEASIYFGKNTKWCTAAINNNMFDSYSEYGRLYIILFKKENKRWQFHFETGQFMDEEDYPLSFDDIKTVIELFPQHCLIDFYANVRQTDARNDITIGLISYIDDYTSKEIMNGLKHVFLDLASNVRSGSVQRETLEKFREIYKKIPNSFYWYLINENPVLFTVVDQDEYSEEKLIEILKVTPEVYPYIDGKRVTKEINDIMLSSNAQFLSFIDDPTEEQMLKVVKAGKGEYAMHYWQLSESALLEQAKLFPYTIYHMIKTRQKNLTDKIASIAFAAELEFIISKIEDKSFDVEMGKQDLQDVVIYYKDHNLNISQEQIDHAMELLSEYE